MTEADVELEDAGVDDAWVERELAAAREHLAAGRTLKLRRHCRNLLERVPEHVDALLLLAAAGSARGRASETADLLDRAAAAAPGDVRVQLARGRFFVAQKRFHDAVDEYRAALAQEPDRLEAVSGLAVALQSLGDADGALEHYRHALELDPHDARMHHNLGTLLKQRHDFEGALEAYRRAIRLAPHEKGFRLRLGLALVESGQFREGAENLDVLAKQLPNDVTCAYIQAYAHMKLGEGPQAVDAAERLLRIQGPTEASLTSIASTQLCAGNPEPAREAAEEALRVGPGNRQALSDYAIALAQLDEPRRARWLFDTDRLLYQETQSAPPGYASVSEFNQALLAHIESHPNLDFDRVSLSCHEGSTSTDLFVEPLGPMAAMRDMILAAARRFRASMPEDPSHPYLANVPRDVDALELAAWATVLRNQGYQHGHIHATAWLSGVYYVSLPEVVNEPPGPGEAQGQGWIEFGRAPYYYRARHQGAIHTIAPREGLMVLFPSYFYHRTLPFASDSKRITIAFDLAETDTAVRSRSTYLD